MSSREMSMDTTMEDDESFVSNTNATIYGASYISGRTESLISGPNIPNSSSTSEDGQQQQISTAAGCGSTDDSLNIESSCASSSWFKNHYKQSVEHFDFRAPPFWSSSSSSHHQLATHKSTAFRRCISIVDPNLPIAARHGRQNSMFKRSLTFFRNLYIMRMSEQFQVVQKGSFDSKRPIY